MKTLVTSALLAIIVTIAGCEGRREAASPIVLPDSTKTTLQELSQLATQLASRASSQTGGKLSEDVEARIRDQAVSSRAQLLLAHAHLVAGDYTKGIDALHSSLGRTAGDAEIHEALANAYYDLAILDMVNRRLYTQNPIGFFMFAPDSRTRSVLLAARAEFDKAASLGRASPSRDRLQNLGSYISGTSTDIAVTIDQAKASEWILALSKDDPGLTQQVKRNLDAFRWMLLPRK